MDWQAYNRTHQRAETRRALWGALTLFLAAIGVVAVCMAVVVVFLAMPQW